jgi:hypothetical protein
MAELISYLKINNLTSSNVKSLKNFIGIPKIDHGKEKPSQGDSKIASLA